MLEIYVKTRPPSTLLGTGKFTAKFNRENFSRAALEELIDGNSLFGEKLSVHGEDLLANFETEIEELFSRLVESQTKFVFIEEELGAPLAKKIIKLGGLIKEAKPVTSKPSFNVFALSDALGARDRKKLWVTFEKALMCGLPAEEIFWKFQWQIKNLLLVKAGPENVKTLNPFVASKAEFAAKNYETEELKTLSRELVGIFHASRRGERDLEVGLERLILSL